MIRARNVGADPSSGAVHSPLQLTLLCVVRPAFWEDPHLLLVPAPKKEGVHLGKETRRNNDPATCSVGYFAGADGEKSRSPRSGWRLRGVPDDRWHGRRAGRRYK